MAAGSSSITVCCVQAQSQKAICVGPLTCLSPYCIVFSITPSLPKNLFFLDREVPSVLMAARENDTKTMTILFKIYNVNVKNLSE